MMSGTAKLSSIVPAVGATVKTKDLPLFGLWTDRDQVIDPSAYVRDLRRPRVSAAPVLPILPLGPRKP